MNIELEYKTLNDVRLFKIMNDNRQVGEFSITEWDDSYTLSFKVYVDFYLINKGLDDKLDVLFNNIFKYTATELDSNKPLLLLEDESIANRYAITHNLRKVPRYNGFYLYNC